MSSEDQASIEPGQPYTVAELMIVSMAREIADGDCLAQGIATHLPACAYFLAQRTHAPDCVFLYSVGGSFSARQGRLGLTGIERIALMDPLRRVGYSEIVCDTLPGMPFKEFSRPAQVDRFGNTNNVVIGSYRRPRLRLPGAGGIPDFSPYESHASFLYVPRHDRLTFVAELDFRSGIGHLSGEDRPERLRRGVTGHGTKRAITNLGIFDFTRDGMSVTSLHPGVSADEVTTATSFEVSIPAAVHRTPPPTEDELRLIRDDIDPLGVRDLEFLTGSERIDRIRAIYAREITDRPDTAPVSGKNAKS